MSGPPANANGRREKLTSESYYRAPRVSQATLVVWRQAAGAAAFLRTSSERRSARNAGRLRRADVR